MHESDQECSARVRKLKRLVRDVLHHAETLVDVLLDLQVHEDGTDEASSEHFNCLCRNDAERCVSENRLANEQNHAELNAKDKECCAVGLENFILVKLKVLLNVPVESLERHRVSIAAKGELLVESNDCLELILDRLLLLSFDLFLEVQGTRSFVDGGLGDGKLHNFIV